MAESATKQHILESTISAIEKFGIQNVTTRVIAEEAGVNNAALHYYYGTKEKLVAEAMKRTLDHMMEDTRDILAGEGSIRERLRALFEYLIVGIFQFPNLIRAHLNGPLMEGNANSPFYDMLDAWSARMREEMLSVLPPERQSTMAIALHVAFMAPLMSGLMPGAPGRPAYMDMHNEDFRREYIEYLIDGLLAGSGQ